MHENAELKSNELGEVNPGYVYEQTKKPEVDIPEEEEAKELTVLEEQKKEVDTLIPEEIGEVNN